MKFFKRKKKTIRSRTKGQKIATLAMLVIGIFIIVGLFLPTEFNVIRVRYIKAKPSAVSLYVNDLRKWGTWFPWKQLGKPHYLKFGDITSGVGAHMSWINKGGKGSLTFTKSSPEKGIDYDLSLYDGFLKFDVSLLHTEFKKGKTYVSWAVKGTIDTPIVGGYMALLMEPVAGAILNRGLKNLKRNVKRDIKKQEKLKQPVESAP